VRVETAWAAGLGLLFLLFRAGGHVTTAAGAETPETVRLPSADGKTSLVGYLVALASSGSHPVVVLLHGRSGPYRARAERFFHGYLGP